MSTLTGVLAALRSAPPVTAMLAIIALLVALVLGGGGGPDHQTSDRHYEAAVRTLVADDWFELQIADQGQSRVRLRPDPATGEVDPERSAILATMERLVTTRKEDGELVVGDLDRFALWTPADDRNLSGTPIVGFEKPYAAANIFADRSTWRGEIGFASSRAADIIPLVSLDAEGQVHFDSSVYLETGLWDEGEAVFDVDDPPSDTAASSSFRLLCGGTTVGRVYRVEEELLVRSLQGDVNYRGNQQCTLRVGSRRLGLARQCDAIGERCRFAVLRLGDTLYVDRPDGSSASFQRRVPLSKAKALRRDSSGGRIMAQGFEGVIEPLLKDLKIGLVQCGRVPTDFDLDCDEDFNLSIDKQIQEDVKAALDDVVARKGAPEQTRSAVVVMNALSGEVLAMAGTHAPFDPRESCIHPAMCAFPVGSVAKPIFAAAMIGTPGNADLVTLKVPARKDPTDILGMPVGRLSNSGRDRGAEGVDLTEFITYSDNYYMAALALLASTQTGSSGAGADGCRLTDAEWYSLGDVLRRQRPRSAFENRDCEERSLSMAASFRPAWADTLEAEFGVDAWSLGARARAPCYLLNYRTSVIWSGLLREEANGCATQYAGQERWYMGIDQQTSFRGQLVSMTLGNGDGLWTTIDLAQAYSRLATGRRVEASLVERRGPRRGSARAVSPDFDAARRAVSRGMAGVVTYGTASGGDVWDAVNLRLRQAEESGLRLGVFAKTGTPQIAPGSDFAAPCTDKDKCFGKAFAITIATYRPEQINEDDSDTAGFVTEASAVPACAVTIAVNLPQKFRTTRDAQNIAAKIIKGPALDNLFDLGGGFCDQ